MTGSLDRRLAKLEALFPPRGGSVEPHEELRQRIADMWTRVGSDLARTGRDGAIRRVLAHDGDPMELMILLTYLGYCSVSVLVMCLIIEDPTDAKLKAWHANAAAFLRGLIGEGPTCGEESLQLEFFETPAALAIASTTDPHQALRIFDEHRAQARWPS
jgi:hypothetical protein